MAHGTKKTTYSKLVDISNQSTFNTSKNWQLSIFVNQPRFLELIEVRPAPNSIKALTVKIHHVNYTMTERHNYRTHLVFIV